MVSLSLSLLRGGYRHRKIHNQNHKRRSNSEQIASFPTSQQSCKHKRAGITVGEEDRADSPPCNRGRRWPTSRCRRFVCLFFFQKLKWQNLILSKKNWTGVWRVAEMCIPESIVASFTHDIFIKGCQVNFSLDKPTDLEATSLYPEMQFRTIDECFDEFVEKIMGGQAAAEKAAGKEGIVVPASAPDALVITATCAWSPPVLSTYMMMWPAPHSYWNLVILVFVYHWFVFKPYLIFI